MQRPAVARPAGGFWDVGSTSSGESESESEYSSDGEDVQQPSAQQGQQRATLMNRLLAEESSDEEEAVRVVKSARQKFIEQYGIFSKGLKAHVGVSDFAALNEDLASAQRLLKKSGAIASKASSKARFLPAAAPTTPAWYLRVLLRLDDAIAKAASAKLSKDQLRMMSRLKTTIKKLINEHASEVTEFGQNPVASADEFAETGEDGDENEESESDEDEAHVRAEAAFRSSSAKDPNHLFESESEEGEEEADESSESEGEESAASASSDEEGTAPTETSKMKQLIEARKRKAADEKAATEAEAKAAAKREAARRAASATGGVAELRLSDEAFEAQIRSLLEQQRKGGATSSVSGHLGKLEKIFEQCRSVQRIVGLGMHLVGAVFDSAPADGRPLSVFLMGKCYGILERMLDVLNTPGAVASGKFSEMQPIADNIEKISKSAAPSTSGQVEEVSIVSSLYLMVEQLHIHWTRTLQHEEHGSTLFISTLEEEYRLMDVCERLAFFYGAVAQMPQHQALAQALLVDHLYYKRLSDHELLSKKAKEKLAALYADRERRLGSYFATALPATASHGSLIEELARNIYKYSAPNSKHRALVFLQHVYHVALHDQFALARDMLLGSRILHSLQLGSVLLNYSVLGGGIVIGIDDASLAMLRVHGCRAVVQLGLCAFRCGLFAEAHDCLMPLYANSRHRELLAQAGVTRQMLPNEAIQRKNTTMPLHLHISLSMFSFACGVSAMFVEIPLLAAHRQPHLASTSKRHSFKVFHKLLDSYLPMPENIRDVVMLAARHMYDCDWQLCVDTLMAADIWRHFGDQTEQIRALVKAKVQEETLRTYLLSSVGAYSTISVAVMAEMFSMDGGKVYELIARMLVTDDRFNGTLDFDSKTVRLDDAEANVSSVEMKAWQYADTLGYFYQTMSNGVEQKKQLTWDTIIH